MSDRAVMVELPVHPDYPSPEEIDEVAVEMRKAGRSELSEFLTDVADGFRDVEAVTDAERFYAKRMFVCLECGKEWDTPGAAQICHKKDRIMELVRELEDEGVHRHFALNEAIETLEETADRDDLEVRGVPDNE